MEKKTIGSFIAVLRKANGMTQAQLAERLGVSNKTVSHWEQDDSAPDLSLIPVIAELFGVTCDELLKGERMTADTEVSKNSGRAEREAEAVFIKTKSKFRIGTIISTALLVIALISVPFALSGDSFKEYVVIAVISGVFAAVSAACQAVFLSCSLGGMLGTDIELDTVYNFKKRALLGSSFIISLDAGVISSLALREIFPWLWRKFPHSWLRRSLTYYLESYNIKFDDFSFFTVVLLSVAIAMILTVLLYNIILHTVVSTDSGRGGK